MDVAAVHGRESDICGEKVLVKLIKFSFLCHFDGLALASNTLAPLEAHSQPLLPPNRRFFCLHACNEGFMTEEEQRGKNGDLRGSIHE